jgi:hypothetical protein
MVEAIFIGKVSAVDPAPGGCCWVHVVSRRNPWERWEWSIELPPIEYSPMVGDEMNLQVGNVVSDYTVTAFQLKNGPWLVYPTGRPYLHKARAILAEGK